MIAWLAKSKNCLACHLLLFLFICRWPAGAEETPDKSPPTEKPATAETKDEAHSWRVWDGQETVEAYALHEGLKSTLTIRLGSKVEIPMVLIPAGKFVMGSSPPKHPSDAAWIEHVLWILAAGLLILLVVRPGYDAVRLRRRPQFSLKRLVLIFLSLSFVAYVSVRAWDLNERWNTYTHLEEQHRLTSNHERMAHLVTISQPFYMSKYEVTIEAYLQVGKKKLPEYYFTSVPVIPANHPIDYCTKAEAEEFCAGVCCQFTAYTVCLPNEEQWEFACRAGTTTNYYTGDSESDLRRAGWYRKNNGGMVHPVGEKEPNFFGLYDMHGNVAEWCSNKFYPYPGAWQNTPDPTSEILRGGYYTNAMEERLCRSSSRTVVVPDSGIGGIRLVAPVKKARDSR